MQNKSVENVKKMGKLKISVDCNVVFNHTSNACMQLITQNQFKTNEKAFQLMQSGTLKHLP